MARNEYKGFSTFFDIEDEKLRNYNQARVMVNMAETFMKKPKEDSNERQISPGGAAVIIGYMNEIPVNERGSVLSQFMSAMKERGYAMG